MTVIVKGVLSYPSFIGVTYEEETSEILAVAIVRQMKAIETYARTRNEHKSNAYELTMDALRHMLSECAKLDFEANPDQYAENIIVHRSLLELQRAGFTTHLSDNGKAKSIDLLLRQLPDSEEAVVYVKKSGEFFGWVLFVYGNGADILADYTINLESALGNVQSVADALS